MQSIASIASLNGKFANSSGRKTVIQALRDPLEISELTGHANPESIASYSHNPLEKQRRMSNKLAGFNPSTTTTNTANSYSSHALREIVPNSSAPPSNTAANSSRDSSANRSSYLMAGAVGEMFTGVTFNNPPVNISINFQANATPKSDSLQWKKNS